MTRLWTEGEPIQMTTDANGVPQAFIWQQQRHPVQTIGKRWRVDVGWWRVHIWREHYKLTTQTGLLVIVYHDLVNDQWFLQRIYD